MEIEQDQSTDNSVEEGVSVVEEDTGAVEVGTKPKKATPKAKTAKKAPVKRKNPTAKSKRPRKAAEPVVEPTPVMTMAEAGVKLGEAKEEFKNAVAEPVVKALGRYSEMARDGLGGLISGFLGSKKRG